MQQLLLVDSGTNSATRLKSYLNRIGYTVSAIVRSAEQAAENARTLDPDFIVMDFNIRNKEVGNNLYDRIRQYNPEIPILYMSAPAA